MWIYHLLRWNYTCLWFVMRIIWSNQGEFLLLQQRGRFLHGSDLFFLRWCRGAVVVPRNIGYLTRWQWPTVLRPPPPIALYFACVYCCVLCQPSLGMKEVRIVFIMWCFLVFSIPNPNPIELKCHQQHTVCPSLFSCFVRGRLLTEVVKFKMLQKFKKSKHSGIWWLLFAVTARKAFK